MYSVTCNNALTVAQGKVEELSQQLQEINMKVDEQQNEMK